MILGLNTIARIISNKELCTALSGDHIVNLMHAFTVCAKHRLRSSECIFFVLFFKINVAASHKQLEMNELEHVLRESTIKVLMEYWNRPLMIVKMISGYIDRLVELKQITINHAIIAENSLTEILRAFDDCKSITNIPIPIPYTNLIRQILFMYCVMITFVFAYAYQHWYIILISVGLISFVLLGIEEIGRMLENPFGLDHCDLPLEKYVESLKRDLQAVYELSSLSEERYKQESSGNIEIISSSKKE